MEARKKTLQVRVTAEELRQLKAIAEQDGCSGSDVIRLFIRQAYRDSLAPRRPPELVSISREPKS